MCYNEREVMKMTLGQKIKKARQNADLTQKQLAELIGAKHNSVSNWEKGVSKPSQPLRVQIAQATGISVEELTEGKEAPQVGFRLKGDRVWVDMESTFGRVQFDKEVKIYTDFTFGARVIAREYSLMYTGHDGEPDTITVVLPGDEEPVYFEHGVTVELKNPRLVFTARQDGGQAVIHHTLYADGMVLAGAPTGAEQE